jgi:adhesin/invasin
VVPEHVARTRWTEGPTRIAGGPAWLRALGAVVAAAAIVAVSVLAAQPARAATYHLVVDSVEFGGPDGAPGDGHCATAAGACTLRAALEESNALNRPAGEVLITVADGLSGNIEPNGTNTAAASNRPDWMYPTATGSASGRVSTYDVGGAFYRVTAPVTIDLDNRVSINDGAYDTSQGAAFYVDGPGVTFRNASQIFGSGSSFVMGPNADGVLIEGGETRTRASNVADRFLTFTSGSRNITLRDYTVAGFAHYNKGTTANASRSGLLWFDSAANTTFTNYTIDGVLFDYPTSGSCTATDGTGCATSLTDFRTRNAVDNSIQVTGFTFTNSTVRNMPGTKGVFAFAFGDGETQANNTSITSWGVTLRDLAITDNRFLDNRRYNAGAATADPTKYGAFIVLPYIAMHGTNLIARNEFVRAEPGVVSTSTTAGLNPYAIYLQGNTATANDTTQRNLGIVENHFEGYAGQSAVRLYQAGRVTVDRNTFGPRTTSTARGSNLAQAEETGTGTVMVTNSSNSSNRKINTWYPRSASVVSADGTCAAQIQLTALTGTANQTPKMPVRVSYYWTADRTAEVFLGQEHYDTQTNQTATLELPLAGDERLRWIADQSAGNVPVDPATGEVSGYVRVQTQSFAAGSGGGGHVDIAAESSQYSRVAPLTGTCAPALTVEQAADQADPALVRDLRFTVASSLPLDPASLTADDVELSAAATADTLDTARINARVTSVVEVAGSNGTRFDVVARVDDSATVTAAIRAGAVTSAAGFANVADATSIDNQLTFTNPMTVDPARFTLVTGEPAGQEYTLGVRAGAPTPAADLTFTAALDEVATQHGLALSTASPVITAGYRASDPVTVTAAAGDVLGGTVATIAHTVVSVDPGYDGLVVPSVTPVLYATDPTLAIVKQAYVDMTDTASVAAIRATGTEALVDARLTDRQAVCFVYTVTNTSADDWATVLTDAVITDTDTRLGEGGAIGTVPRLGIGQSAELFACTSLVPVDTTADPVAP